MSQRGERDALRLISYGLYLLTTTRGPEVNAITCNWVVQISFEPLLIAVAVEKQSHSHVLIQESPGFALNFLSLEQVGLARRMATPYRLNPHKLAGVAYHTGATGAPVLDEAIAFLECQVKKSLELGGDHTLFVGEVVAGGVNKHAEPLSLLASRLHYK